VTERTFEGASIVVAGATGGIGRHLAHHLAQRGAHLTLTARDPSALVAIGIDATLVPAGMVAYAASKAALTAADRALARELRVAGIGVTDARPPHTETGLADRPIAADAFGV